MIFVKQSTAVTVKLGPFLDETTGKDAETALTIAQADVRLSKNGGDMAQKNNATSCTHDEIGVYDCPLSTTDTNTLGVLAIYVHKTGALPVWEKAMVMPANVWDSLLGSDKLQVDVAQWLGTAPNALVSSRVDVSVGAMAANVLTAAAINADAITAAKIADGAIDAATFASGAINAAAIAADAIGSSEFAQAAADKIWSSAARTLTAATNITSSGGVINVTSGVVDTVGALGATAKTDVNSEVDTALADANLNDLIQITGSVNDVSPAAGSFAGDAGLEGTNDDFYNGLVLVFTSGNLAGIGRRISDYTASSRLITLEKAFPIAPANSDQFSIIGLEVMEDTIAELAAIQSDTDNIQTRLPGTLDTGRMRCVVESMNANVVTLSAMAAGAIDSSVFAAGALDANALATDAVDEIVDQVWDEAKAGHVGAGSFGEEVQSHALSSEVAAVETDTQDIQSRLPTTLIGGRMDSTMTAIAGDATAASRLKDSAGTMVTATVQTGSDLDTITTDLTETTDDHYKGRVVIFLTGALANQAVEITAYTGASKDLTVTSMTEPPSNGDTFVIV